MSQEAPKNATPTESNQQATQEASIKGAFNEDLIKKYPKANKKLSLGISPYSLLTDAGDQLTQSVYISPFGMQFQTTQAYTEGTLLKIDVNVPDYWRRKQQFVDYRRIDTPDSFKVLAKVVRSEDVGKRGKKKLIVVQTVNMDEVDEQVLKAYLQE